MSHYQEVLGIAAGVLSLVGYVPYIISTLKGVTQPNKASWIIWTIVGGLLAGSYIAEGDPHAIWLPIGYFLGPLIVAILSFRYGYSVWTKLDTFCIIAAIISIIPWILSKDATMTLLINIAIDSTGAIPTLVKAYREPETEDANSWLIFFTANTIQLAAVSVWNIAALYPIYLFILAGTIVVFTTKDRVKKHFAWKKLNG